MRATVTNTAGMVVGRVDMYPYGEIWSETGTTTKYKFSEKERDSESGNDYFGARYYWSGAGRWLGADPVLGDPSDPQRLNRYSYAMSDPVNFIDPDGADPRPINIGLGEGNGGGTTVFSGPTSGPGLAYGSTGLSRPQIEESWLQHVTARRDIGSWAEALFGLLSLDQRVNRGLNTLEKKLAPENISKDCKELFATLGVSVSDFLSKLGTLVFMDGTTSTDLVSAVNGEQFARTRGIVGWTIADLFEKNFPGVNPVDPKAPKKQINGWSPAHLPTVYLRPSATSAELIAHEALHKFPDLDDDALKDLMKIPKDKDSGAISTEFKKKCL